MENREILYIVVHKLFGKNRRTIVQHQELKHFIKSTPDIIGVVKCAVLNKFKVEDFKDSNVLEFKKKH